MTKKTRIVFCQGPIQLLNCIALLECRKTLCPAEAHTDYLLLGGMCSQDKTAGIVHAAQSIATLWPWEKIVDLSADETSICQQYRNAPRKAEGMLREICGLPGADEVFTQRNWQPVNEVLLNAYRDAYHVCTGDGLGIVDFSFTDYFVPYHEVNTFLSIFHNNFRENTAKTGKKPLLRIFDRQHLLAAIDRYIAVSAEYRGTLPTTRPEAAILLLTSNLSEAEFAPLASEIDLYVNLVAAVYRGEEVVVKPHPRERSDKADMVANALRERLGAQVHCIEHPLLRSLPVEILLRQYRFRHFLGLQTSAMRNALFLYGKEPDRFCFSREILPFYYPGVRNYLGNLFRMEKIIQKRIATWDGKSILFDTRIDKRSRADYQIFLQGERLARQGKRKEASECFRKANEIDSNFALPYFGQGLLDLEEGEPGQAIRNLRKAYECNPSNAGLVFDLYHTMVKAAGNEEAETMLDDFFASPHPAIDAPNIFLRLFTEATPSLQDAATEARLDTDCLFDLLESWAEKNISAEQPEGRFLRQLMGTAIGSALRRRFHHLRPTCKEFPGNHVVILSDGSVTTCCMDWRGSNTFASLYEKPLEKIWKEEVRAALRGDLYDFELCSQCVGSARTPQLTADTATRQAWRRTEEGFPDSLTIEVMGACNYACCPAREVGTLRPVKPDLGLIFAHIESMLPGIRRLRLFNWGEPLLHDGLADFITQCRKASPKIVLLVSSNGILLDEAMARCFVNNRVEHLVISAHGAPGTESMLRYSKKNADYDKVLGNVRRLLDIRNKSNAVYPKVSLRAILFSWNDSEEAMGRFRRDAASLGLSAANGHPDHDNYHWILDSGGLGKNASKRFYRGSGELERLINDKEFFAPKAS
ncbi:MAG: hypothetical protein BM485_03135 [Desulfobulbaceae bacterium DB1]|nr:MAG: hypothetical protein BM485_03135 [Desulfobulbaceae bacterium DB1]